MIKEEFKKSRYSKGYTLLFAVLVASITLAIGVSILNISKKEFLLSSSARESSISFYAADSGLECAMYQEELGLFPENGSVSSFVCNGKNITPSYANNTFTFYIDLDGGKCASVTIKKEIVSNILKTTIESRGYNIGWQVSSSNCERVSPKKVERALRIIYQ